MLASKTIKTLTLLITFFTFLQVQALGPVPVDILRGTKKVSLVFVGSKDGLSESSFGHISLRFSPNETLGPFDTSLQFVAKLPQGESLIKKYSKGFGLFGNYAYDVNIEVDSFTNYKILSIRNEDRDVHVLTLDLDNAQIEKLIHYIENFFNEGVQKYRFFNKNCSSFVAAALEYATGLDLKSKSFPWKLGKSVEEAGLVAETLYFPSNSSAKVEITDKIYQNQEMAALLSPYVGRDQFLADLKSEELEVKSSSFFSLLAAIKTSGDQSGIVRDELVSSYLSLASKENEFTQAYFKAILKNLDTVDIRRMSSEHRFSQEINSKSRNITTTLSVRKNKPQIGIVWDEPKTKGREKVSFDLPFLDFQKGSGFVEYNGVTVGNFIKTRKESWISSKGINYSVSLRKDSNTVEVLVLVFNNVASTRRTKQEFEAKSFLAINNMFDFDSSDTLGACLAMVKLQKAMSERVHFNPEAQWNTDFDKKEVLLRVLGGEYVMIPGFSGIKDFTASIPKEEFVEFVSTLQKGINSNSRKAFFDGMFEYQEIKSKTLSNLIYLLNAGQSVELVVGMKKVGSRRYEKVSHVVLVNSISKREDGSGYDLFIYDPNLGHTSIQLKNDFTLEFPSIYRKDLIYNAILYKQSKDAIDYDLGNRSLELNLRKLEKRSSRGYPLFFIPLNYSY